MPTSINEILDKYDELSYEDKEYVIDILNKRIIEYRRMQISKRGEEAVKNYQEGNSKIGSAEDLFKDLEND
jgi:hypothetical protein